MTLEEVLRYINNRFDKDAHDCPYGSKCGTFEVKNGSLDADWLADRQYYWIEGSLFNDGLHMHPDDELRDEVFDGRIITLAIPKQVVEIAGEIDNWAQTNAKALNGPYQSESFGGYSYSLAGNGGGDVPTSEWQAKFGPRLRQFRKLSRDWV